MIGLAASLLDLVWGAGVVVALFGVLVVAWIVYEAWKQPDRWK